MVHRTQDNQKVFIDEFGNRSSFASTTAPSTISVTSIKTKLDSKTEGKFVNITKYKEIIKSNGLKNLKLFRTMMSTKLLLHVKQIFIQILMYRQLMIRCLIFQI